MAVDKLPNFLASPTPDDKPGPHHQCSIHLNCESVEVLETAYKEAVNGRPSARYVYLHKFKNVHHTVDQWLADYAKYDARGKHFFNAFEFMFSVDFLVSCTSDSVITLCDTGQCVSERFEVGILTPKFIFTFFFKSSYQPPFTLHHLVPSCL